jgi:glycosyltransferase involved in cell wall biosynthesis
MTGARRRPAAGPTRLAFVVPRYGPEILGGAETITRHLVEHLPAAEFSAEVLTTCAKDLVTWRNVYPPGPTEIRGVPVCRFPIDPGLRDPRRYQALTDRFTNHQPTTVEEEYEWIDNSGHSPALYEYIARRGQEYDLLIFGPYLAGTTFYGTTLRPERSILWPHLHDEPFAYFQQTRLMMEACRGIMFNSKPELVLALHRLGIRNPGSFLVGEGLDEGRGNPDRFRRRFGLEGPFVLCAGRLDETKNLLTLFAYFLDYKRRRPGPLKLVLVGRGSLPIPADPDILPLGFLSEQDKLDGYAAATVLCQPSVLESFSLVMMESWLMGVPVLVHGACEVTCYHVLQSNGGLYFTSAAEFDGALDWLLSHPHERRQMGALGQAYVRREFSWPVTLERFADALASWSVSRRTEELWR